MPAPVGVETYEMDEATPLEQARYASMAKVRVLADRILDEAVRSSCEPLWNQQVTGTAGERWLWASDAAHVALEAVGRHLRALWSER
jgi:hypothetical protein